KWDPTDPSHYWPPGAAREATVKGFQEAFATEGFEECEDASLEVGFEKIAIYANQNGATHAARQLPNGLWTSKLGDGWDIEHAELSGISSGDYGLVLTYMKRLTQRS